MTLILLSINGTDLTEYIDVQNYNVNRQPVFENWTDGNHITRRNIIRYRIAGEFKVGFRNNADVVAFLETLNGNQTPGGYFPVSIFVNNDNTNYTANVFMDGAALIARDLENGRVWHEYTIKIEER